MYLDANATTRILPGVLEAMMPWLQDGYANPSGTHTAARRARAAIDRAREQVATLIGASPGEIVFTSGGTESANTAIHSMDHLAGPGAAVVSVIEHSAVLRTAENLGRPLRWLPVNSGGVVDLAGIETISDGVSWMSVMLANNETGVIQPIADIAGRGRVRGIPVHTDAVQAVGKMPVDVRSLGVDMLSLSAHKFHGPKGIGALFVRSGLCFEPLLTGGGQEDGRRSGTENTAAIVGMGAAAEFALEFLTSGGGAGLAAMRDLFESRVVSGLSGVTVNGDVTRRLANTSHLSFDACDAAGLLILLDEADVACSAGSSCMSGRQKPSHVQLAMGIPEARAKSSLRFGFSKLNTLEQAASAADRVIRAVEKLRRVQGPGVGPVVVYSP
jgi:cysteine desulfurase